MRFISIFLLTISCYANDCVPLTFDTLSRLANKHVDYSSWYNELMPDGVVSDWDKGYESWNKRFMLTPLICIYSNISTYKVESQNLLYGVPYLWVGRTQDEIDRNAPDDQCHAAIAYLTHNEVIVIHTIKPSTYFFEHLDKTTFVKRTLLIYRVGNIEINWQKIPKEL